MREPSKVPLGDLVARAHKDAPNAAGTHPSFADASNHGCVPFPSDDVILSHILVVEDINRSVAWYRDALGATLFREYGGTTAVFEVNGAWLVLVTGGPGTPDKPNVTMQAPADPDSVSHSMTFRVQDCRAAHDDLRRRGVTFLTEPVESEWEIRVFFRDPDGHLFELSQAKEQ